MLQIPLLNYPIILLSVKNAFNCAFFCHNTKGDKVWNDNQSVACQTNVKFSLQLKSINIFRRISE